MCLVLIKSIVVCLLLGIHFKKFGFKVCNQCLVVRNELSVTQSEHIVLRVHIYADGIILSYFFIVLVAITIPSQYEMDVVASDDYCI